MEVKVAILNFFKFVIRSFFLSLIVSLAGYCFLTKKFPPDFHRLKNIYASYQKLTSLTKEIQDSQKLQAAATTPRTANEEDQDLAKLLEHRRQLVDLLSQFNFAAPPPQKSQSTTPVEGGSQKSQVVEEPTEVILSARSYRSLQLQLGELTRENEELRKEIEEFQKKTATLQQAGCSLGF